MKRLLLMRHGEYQGDTLTDTGRFGVGMMAGKIKELLSELRQGSVEIISSTFPRAKESAAVLSKALGIVTTAKSYDCLREEGDEMTDANANELMKLVEGDYADTDILIAVTHNPVCQDFPLAYAWEHKLTGKWVRQFPSYAQCVLINFDDNTCDIFRNY